jgi:hypothetical protein
MINDYAELIAEVAERSGVSGVANRADMFTGLAESWLNRHLKTSEMEATATITTDASGEADLPSDFQRSRRVRVGTVNMAKVPFSSITTDSGKVYAIQGAKIVTGSPSTDVVIDYYEKIPSLTANSTNWLLDLDGGVYLNAILYQVYDSKNDERAQGAMNAARGLVDEINHDDAARRHAGTIIKIGGATP